MRTSVTIIREGGEVTRVLDPHGTVLLDEPDDGATERAGPSSSWPTG
jgi:hypothetical protein